MSPESRANNPPQVFTKDTVQKITELPGGSRVLLYVTLDTMTTSDHGYRHPTMINAGFITVKDPLLVTWSTMTGPSSKGIKEMPRTAASFSLQLTGEQRDEFESREREFHEKARREKQLSDTDEPVEELTGTARRAAWMKKEREKEQRLARFLAEAFINDYPEVLAGKTVGGEAVDPTTVKDVRFAVSLTDSMTPSPEIFTHAKRFDPAT